MGMGSVEIQAAGGGDSRSWVVLGCVSLPLRPPVCLSAQFSSRTIGQIKIKFGMEGLPLGISPEQHV